MNTTSRPSGSLTPRRRTVISGALLTATLLAAACSGGGEPAAETPLADEPAEEAPAPETTVVATTVAETTTTEALPVETLPDVTTTTIVGEPEFRIPLLGTIVDSADAYPDRPALAVKIPNNSKAMPQTGLNEADIVYEEIINDRITRFAAVFHSQGSEPVGPIRSGRAQDIDLLSNLNGPLYAWSGGNDGVTRLVRASTFIDLDGRYTSGYYRRDGRGGAPHNLFSSTEALWSHTPDEYTTPVPVFPYLLPGEEISGDPGTSVAVTLDSVDVLWGWDPNRGSYFRWQEGDPHMTELTGQASTENVVIMFVDYVSGVVDSRSPEAQTVGTGRVIVLSEGIAREGIWTRPDKYSAWEFYTDESRLTRIPLTPGRTWVELPRDDPANVVLNP